MKKLLKILVMILAIFLIYFIARSIIIIAF